VYGFGVFYLGFKSRKVDASSDGRMVHVQGEWQGVFCGNDNKSADCKRDDSGYGDSDDDGDEKSCKNKFENLEESMSCIFLKNYSR